MTNELKKIAALKAGGGCCSCSLNSSFDPAFVTLTPQRIKESVEDMKGYIDVASHNN